MGFCQQIWPNNIYLKMSDMKNTNDNDICYFWVEVTIENLETREQANKLMILIIMNYDKIYHFIWEPLKNVLGFLKQNQNMSNANIVILKSKLDYLWIGNVTSTKQLFVMKNYDKVAARSYFAFAYYQEFI